MVHPFLQQKLPEVQRLFKEHKIKRAYAFGSVVTDKFNDESDVDFLISFEDNLDPLVSGENYWSLLETFQDLFKRDVDLVTERSLRNPYFIERLNETKQLIYEQ